MNAHIKKFRRGFKHSHTIIVPEETMGIKLELIVLEAGDEYENCLQDKETCILLLEGEVDFSFNHSPILRHAKRQNLFEENPATLLVPKGCKFKIRAYVKSQLIEVHTDNSNVFTPMYCGPDDVKEEWRGNEKLGNRRLVKTVFDYDNAPQSNIVIGEVVTSSGQWAGYPPHFHPQPEIYYYRFEPETGFCAGELGNTVHKIFHNDALLIWPGLTHSQSCAPGYTMWYLWLLKHLPNNPYTGFDFVPEHKWILEEEKKMN